ncbi:MAG TPA: 3-deoxy-8-phosphooctulonate synthase [Chitinophagaceae bacterium]|nr:3-deoxy-8-phosphooctulonate synthase [Chitinophagaceae bacterium]
MDAWDLVRQSGDNFFLIAGPCVVEDEPMLMEIAEKTTALCSRLKIPFIFKASYRKANRTRGESFTGIGDLEGLELLQKTGNRFAIPVTTDIHSAAEAHQAAVYADLLQIPAFLCRQTDILEAAASTGKTINVKKGQFASGQAMQFAVEKIRSQGNDHILLTERGTTFGYQDLVVDFRNIPWMQAHRVPVVVDCTHSLQQPNQPGGITGGDPALISTIARAAIAAGADGIFIETHPDPSRALSDGANMLPLDLLEQVLEPLVRIRHALKSISRP